MPLGKKVLVGTGVAAIAAVLILLLVRHYRGGEYEGGDPNWLANAQASCLRRCEESYLACYRTHKEKGEICAGGRQRCIDACPRTGR